MNLAPEEVNDKQNYVSVFCVNNFTTIVNAIKLFIIASVLFKCVRYQTGGIYYIPNKRCCSKFLFNFVGQYSKKLLKIAKN